MAQESGQPATLQRSAFPNDRLINKLVDLLLELRDVVEIVNGRQRDARERPSEWERRVGLCACRAYEEVSSLIEEQSA